MWSDKETTEDLLGYTVHASLLKSVVTNDKNLLEKPRDFDPFGQTGFAHLWLQYD